MLIMSRRWTSRLAAAVALSSSASASARTFEAFVVPRRAINDGACRFGAALGMVATGGRRQGSGSPRQAEVVGEKFGEEGTESSLFDLRWDGSLPPDVAARRRMSSAAETSMTSIIDDGDGHINADLARSIWEWENEHLKEEEGEGEGGVDGKDGKGKKKSDDFPAARLKFSTRAGLRIVDEVAREMMALASESAAEGGSRSSSDSSSSSPTSSSSTSSSSSDDVSSSAGGAAASYSDLCQEGTIALMRAMSKYDPATSPDAPSFEAYARRKIRKAMARSVADTARPLRLPSRVHDVLKAARREADRLRSSSDLEGREPTLEEIAAVLKMSPDRLRFYGLVGRDAVPVEGTVEIYDPDAPPGDALAFADEDAYETATGKDEALLHGGEVLAEVLEEEDEWVEPREKLVAPLRDAIPDRGLHGPDEEVMEDIMREDVDDLLVKTLDERELAIIRMRFGLADSATSAAGGGGGAKSDHPVYREGMTFAEIGAALGVSRQRAAQIEQRALDKLRDNYSSVFVEQYLDDDHSAEVSI